MRVHCWLMFYLSAKMSRSFSSKLFSSQLGLNLFWCMELVPFQVQGLHESPFSLFLQHVEVPLDDSTPIWYTSHSSQFCIICELAEGMLCPIIKVITESLKSSVLIIEL